MTFSKSANLLDLVTLFYSGRELLLISEPETSLVSNIKDVLRNELHANVVKNAKIHIILESFSILLCEPV